MMFFVNARCRAAARAKGPVPVLINAMHTTTGGGLAYLQNVLAELGKDTRFEWSLLIPKATAAVLQVPAEVRVIAPEIPTAFYKKQIWEQVQVPRLAQRIGARAVLCNANYVPLLAPRPVPILHTTCTAGRFAASMGMRWYWRGVKAMTLLSVLRARRVCAVAGHVRDEFTPMLLKPCRNKVVLTPPGKPPVPAKRPKADPNLVVAVGDMYPQKHYTTLVQAFARLLQERPQSRLVIVGRAVDAGIHAGLKQQIAAQKLQRSITLAGAVDHARLMELMATAAVFISTSEAESFNMPVVEAQALGVPCVLADVPCQRDVGGEAAVYVPVAYGGDVAAAYAMAMFGLLENPSLGAMLAARGKAQVATLTWANTAGAIGNALADVCGMPAVPAPKLEGRVVRQTGSKPHGLN